MQLSSLSQLCGVMAFENSVWKMSAEFDLTDAALTNRIINVT